MFFDNQAETRLLTREFMTMGSTWMTFFILYSLLFVENREAYDPIQVNGTLKPTTNYMYIVKYSVKTF